MTWEMLLLVVIWGALASTVVAMYIRIHISEWGLVGLMLLLGGAWVLVNRSLMDDLGVSALQDEQFYLWRWLAGIGSVIVMAGQIATLKRDRPPWQQVVRRLAFAVAVMVVVFCSLNLYLEMTS